MPKVTPQKPPVTRGPTAARPAAKANGVLSRIRPISMPDNGIKMAIYGRSGSGKTTLACTFPKPLLLMRPAQHEDGRRSVHNVKGVLDCPLQKAEDMADVAAQARATGEWKTIVLDNASAYQDMVLKEILEVDQLPAQLSFGIASRDQWGHGALQMKERLRELVMLNCNVVIIAQERNFGEDDEAVDTDLIMPTVSSRLMPSVTAYLDPAVDYVGQTFIRKEKRTVKKLVGGKEVPSLVSVTEWCLRTGPHPVYSTKFRKPKGEPLPELIVDPTYDKILKLVSG